MIPPRILIAPDKFKGTLSAKEASEAIADGVRRQLPHAELRLCPVADGGEGTLDVLFAAGARRYRAEVTGPTGDVASTSWAAIGNTAVIELAEASGLRHHTPTPENALRSDTVGTGQLVRDAVDRGYRSVALALGGSASTDGGYGILRALGARFLDHAGHPLKPGGGALADLVTADLSRLDRRLAHTAIELLCDVAVPMCGIGGAAPIFSPQKGADDSAAARLGDGLAALASALARTTGRDPAAITWGGAAGGVAGGMYAALDATYASGVDRIADYLGLEDHLEWADIVVVGEGSLDHQSLTGKAPVGLARRARRHNVRIVAVAGQVTLSASELRQLHLSAVASAEASAGSSIAARMHPNHYVAAAAAAAFEHMDQKLGRAIAGAAQRP